MTDSTSVMVGDLPDLIASFARHLRAATRHPRTVEKYVYGATMFVKFLTDNDLPTDAAAIRPEHVEKFMVNSSRNRAPPRPAPATATCSSCSATSCRRARFPRARWPTCARRSNPRRRCRCSGDAPAPPTRRLRGPWDFDSRRDMAIIRLLIDTGMVAVGAGRAHRRRHRPRPRRRRRARQGASSGSCPFGARTAGSTRPLQEGPQEPPPCRAAGLWLSGKGVLTDSGSHS